MQSRLRDFARPAFALLTVLGATGIGSVSALPQAPTQLSSPPAAIDRNEVQRRLQQAADALQRNANADVLAILNPSVEAAVAADPALAAELHYAIATAYYRLTRYTEALGHYQRAIDACRATENRSGEARALQSMAQLHKNQGAYAQGLIVGEQARSMYQALGDGRQTARTDIVLGAIHDLMGEHRRALERYQEAVTLFRDEKSTDVGRLLYEIGISYKNLGNYAEAERYYARALDLETELKDAYGQMFTLGNIAVLHSTLGEDARAAGYTRQALQLARQLRDRRAQMLALLDLGNTYWRLGDTERALVSLQEELAIARDMGARSEESIGLKTLGDIHAAAGDAARARAEYVDALRIQQDISERGPQGSTLVAMADLAVRDGSAADARRFAEQAVSLARDTERPELEWDARRALAGAEAASGRAAQAVDELRASARIINDLRANVVSDTGKIAFVDRRQEVFQTLSALLVGLGRPDEALEAAEAGRARAFADLLAQRQILGKPDERQALAAVRRAQGELRSLSTGAAAPGSDDASRASVRSGGAASLAATVEALRAEHHELASLLTAESPAMADIIATVKRLDGTLVEYLVTDRQLLAWVVTPDGALHATTIDVTRAQLESLTRTVRRSIDSVDLAAVGRAAALDPVLRDLDRLLIAPLAHWLPASPDRPVIVIPHGPLALLPFAALQDARGRPLVERHTLAFAPAASVYQHTGTKLHAASDRPRTLIVADPTPPTGSALGRLPWAREEGRRVAERLRGTPVRFLTGPRASEAAIKSDAHLYSQLHFATHGLIAPDLPLASSIVLGSGDGEDGYLRVDEVFNLDLQADLVVLSGCSTGLGRLSGDGILGMTRAFMYAGTPTVVVSQWDVSDRATAFLMDRFYAALGRGQSKAAALRTAQLATRGRYADPTLWAAFTLVGEPR